MKRRILIYKIGNYGIMAEDQSFRRRYFFSKKKWWNVLYDYGIGVSHIEMEIERHLVRDWILDRVQEYKNKNIQIDIVNETNYDIF